MDLKEAKSWIKQAGSKNVRVVPMPGQGFDGDHQIDISVNGSWSPVITGISKSIAENIVREAVNRVILG